MITQEAHRREFCINDYRIQNVEPTAFYISDFLSSTEESYLMSNILATPKPKWTQLSNRRLQNWGGIPHSKGMIAEAMPLWLQTYLNKIDSLKVMGPNKPNHVLVNEYLPGQGIMPHSDGSLFYPTITTISLNSHIVLKILEPPSESNAKPKPVFSFLLEPRSLIVLQDKLYTHYLHSIEEIHEDVLDDFVANLDMCSEKYVKGVPLKRDTRISMTVRHVPKTTSFKLKLGVSR